MKLTKSASGILSARYRIVLIKCFLANLILLPLPVSAITISSGTYGSEDFRKYNEDVIIEGGIFNNAHIDAPHITVTGGTFNGRADLVASDTLTITGGIFNIPDSIWLDAPNISIDSDKVYLSVKWSKSPESLYPSEYPEIDADVLTISGSRGIFVEDTQVNTLSVSGKITAKGSSFLGNLTETENDIYKINGKTLYSVFNYDFHSNKSNTSFSNSTIHLNGNSVAGSGYYSLVGGIDANGNWDDDLIEDVVMLRNKLTNAEIDTSVAVFMADLKSAKSYDDLMDITRSSFGTIIDSSTDWSVLDYNKIESDLRQKYADFNANLGETGAAVNISASTFVLNDNAKLINDSFKSGDMTVTSSTVTANGNNELSARSGKVIFQNSTLKVAENAVLTFSSAGGALLLDSGSTLDLAGKMKGNVFSDADATVAFQSSNARLDGTLSGAANAVFNADYALSNLNRSNNFEFRNITIMNGKTLDIGTTALKADKISGGTISAILTDAAKTTPIITAPAENVTIKLNMSAASSAQTTLYHITDGTGFKLGDYSTSRYAVSSTPFTFAEASKVGVLSNWSGGDLYILRLGGSTAPIIDDLENNGGIKVHPVIEKASQILDLDDKSLDSLTKEQLDALDKIDDLLAKFDRNPEKKYQSLREVSPDLSTSVSMTDESTAKRIMHAVSSRFNTPASRQISPYSRGGYYYRRMHGRSGGDFEAGQGAVWAQGLYNHAEQRGKEGFSSDSAGFAAGIEAYVSDDFKAGFGYSYVATSIDADRSDTDVYTHTGFAYAHYQPERFYTNFFAGVGHSSYEDTTKIAKLESDYQTNTISAQIAVGYAAPVLSPEAALRVINTHQKAYTDALGAELEAKSSVTATAVGGFRLSKRYRLQANAAASFVPELKAAVSYDFARSNQNRTAVLPNGASYVVETEKDKRFGVEAGAGFSFGFEKIGSLSLMYDGMFQGKLQSHSVLLNMKINL